MGNQINDAIENLTTTVEKVHQDIARKPLDVVELIAPNLPITKTVGEVQARIIGSFYDAIRGVNKALARIVGEARPTVEKPVRPEAEAERKRGAPGA